MDIDEITRKLLGSEEPKKPTISPEKIRLVVERVLSRNNLTLKSIEATEEGDYLAKSTDTGGSRLFSLIRLESSEKGIERGSLEDFYNLATEKNSDRSIFITDSIFREEAKAFAAEKYIILVDGKELEAILTEEETGIKKAFVSGENDREALRYFKIRKREKIFHIIGAEEKIEEIDRRYSLVACYMVSYAGEEVVERTRVYVDLTYGELYWVDKGKVERNDIIKRIMGLPEGARELLIEILRKEKIDQEYISGKDIELLRRKRFVRISSEGETKSTLNIILDEILDFIQLSSRGVSEFGGRASQAGTIDRNELKTTTRRMVSPDLKLKKFDHSYDLESYIRIANPEDGFDPDEIKYDREEVARILDAITEEKEEINFQYLIYMPYYKCTYLSDGRYRYLRHPEPRLKEGSKRETVAVMSTFPMLMETIPMLIATILLLGLLSTFLAREFIAGLFTGDNIMDSFIGAAIGGILFGSSLAAYVFGGELLGMGVSLLAVTAFMVAWVTVGFIYLPAEAELLGSRFALWRNILSFILSIIVAITTILLLPV